jgi:hypothetical protein
MARRRSLVALVALAVLASGCGSSDEDEPQEPPARAADLQQPGDYAYATNGFDRLSAAFSSRHRYPRTSAVSVEPGDCGFSERWSPVPERVSVWRFCIDGPRWRLAELSDYHEFFGQGTMQRFRCRGPFVSRPPTVRIGFRWTDRCRGAGSRVTVRYRAARDQTLQVKGKPVETVLIRARARLRGRIDGGNVYDSWLSRANGQLVRRLVTSDTTVDTPFGEVRNRERYSLRLTSLEPD